MGRIGTHSLHDNDDVPGDDVPGDDVHGDVDDIAAVVDDGRRRRCRPIC